MCGAFFSMVSGQGAQPYPPGPTPVPQSQSPLPMLVSSRCETLRKENVPFPEPELSCDVRKKRDDLTDEE